MCCSVYCLLVTLFALFLLVVVITFCINTHTCLSLKQKSLHIVQYSVHDASCVVTKRSASWTIMFIDENRGRPIIGETQVFELPKWSWGQWLGLKWPQAIWWIELKLVVQTQPQQFRHLGLFHLLLWYRGWGKDKAFVKSMPDNITIGLPSNAKKDPIV